MSRLNKMLDARERKVAAAMLVELRRMHIAGVELTHAVVEIGRRWGDERLAVFVAAFTIEQLNAAGKLPLPENTESRLH